jgi:hypothetical protein
MKTKNLFKAATLTVARHFWSMFKTDTAKMRAVEGGKV